MTCRDCSCAKRGFFKSAPDAIVCTGVKEPFVIDNYPDAECVKYQDKEDTTYSDGVYAELFVMKNGVRYNIRSIEMKEMTSILVNYLMDGIEKLYE